MAFPLPQIERCSKHCKPVLGKHLLEILTSGMYINPLMIYREYIQNAVDSIDLAERISLFLVEKPEIHIKIIPKTRTVSIHDNGTGISNDSAKTVLSNIALSEKDRSIQRGFRGIGRLSGLAYCKEVIFETKTSKDNLVSVFKWDKHHLIQYLHGGGQFDLSELIDRCTTFHLREPHPDEGTHFFCVSLKHIEAFYKDQLLFIPDIKNHIATTCPVPFKNSFEPYRTQILNFLEGFASFKEYKISINGEQIFKPYDVETPISEKSRLKVDSIKLITVPGITAKPIAKGWVAMTNFPGSLPKKIPVRGIRIRQGNIALGDEYFCADFFPEQRFSNWNVGEIHCDSCLVPNARRDGFITNVYCEKLFEALIQLGKILAKAIRNHSKARSLINTLRKEIRSLENESQMFSFLEERGKKHFAKKLSLAKKKLEETEKVLVNEGLYYFYQDLQKMRLIINEIDSCEKRKVLGNNPLDKLPTLKKETIQEICGEIYKKHGHEVLRSVIECLERSMSTDKENVMG